MCRFSFMLVFLLLCGILNGQFYYINETFDDQMTLPAGWSGNMTITPYQGLGGGELGSNSLLAELNSQSTQRNAVTPTIGPIVAGTTITFSYKLKIDINSEDSPVNLQNNTIQVKIGETVVWSRTGATHLPTPNWTVATAIISDDFIGQHVAIELLVTRAPDATTTLAVLFENVEVFGNVPADLMAVSIQGQVMPAVGSQEDYTVTVRNIGETAATDFTVKLMQVADPADIMLASVEVDELEGNTTEGYVLQWTPSEGGYQTIYGLIEYAADFSQENNTTDHLDIYATAEGTTAIYIGDPASNEVFPHPFPYYVPSAVSQQIYLASEIGHYGTIYGLVLRYSSPFYSATVNCPVNLYLAQTNRMIFNNQNRWIPYADFDLVFTGELDVLAQGTYDVIIPFTTPYNYTSGNLVLMGYYATNNSNNVNGQWQATFVTGGSETSGRGLTGNSWGTIDITVSYPSSANSFYSQYMSNVTLLFTDPLTPPTNLTASVDYYTVSLEWEASEQTPLYYHVYRNFELLTESPVSSTAYADTNVPPGTYSYQVSAAYTEGESRMVGVTGVVVYNIQPPSNLQATLTDIPAISLSWQAPFAMGLLHFNVYRRVSPSTEFSLVYQTENPETVTYNDLDINYETDIYYYVTASYPTGESEQSNIVSATTFFVPPANLQAVVGNNSVSLSWDAPMVNPETATLSGYKIMRGEAVLVANQAAETTTYVDNTAQNGEAYTYSVVALYTNPAAESEATTINVQMKVFYPPTELTATVVVSDVTLSWQAPSHEHLAVLGGYLVYRNNVLLVAVEGMTYTDNDVELETDYTYYVVAYFTNPQGVSEPSNSVSARVLSGYDEVIVPVSTCLMGNYPNPFNPETVLHFSLARQEYVHIDIFSVNGQKVRSLVSGVYGAGVHKAIWNGLSDNGRAVSSGIYFYRMRAGEYSSVKKMLLLK